jgi:3',5'-cyclic AMP phosphodiesterase CpdA
VRTLVHLSDLHTGRVDPAILAPLTAAIAGARPDLVVFSGDLTQRATRTQFREARAFLDGLPGPYLVIPGNHDVPLWNAARRFVTPLARYKRFITTDLDPIFEDSEIIVVGVNTARSFTWGEGRINRRQVAAVLRRLQAAPPGVIKIVVTHHPFDLPPGVDERRLLGRARMAMAEFASVGAELFLSGHLHLSHVSHSAERYRIAGHSALIVQAGTVSTRGRGEEPSFNVLRIDGARLSLGRFVWDAETARFQAVAVGEFDKAPDGWKPITETGEPENRRTGEL